MTQNTESPDTPGGFTTACLIWQGSGTGQPKAKLRSALLAGVTPQHCAFDYLWTFFLGLVSLPGAVRWSGRGYTCLEFSCCAGSSRRIRERPSGTTQT
jgi:hypothetical protein